MTLSCSTSSSFLKKAASGITDPLIKNENLSSTAQICDQEQGKNQEINATTADVDNVETKSIDGTENKVNPSVQNNHEKIETERVEQRNLGESIVTSGSSASKLIYKKNDRIVSNGGRFQAY